LRDDGDAAWRIGHDVFRPVFDAFARWVADEAAALARDTGRPVRLLFLLRDGFLPQCVSEALGESGAAIAISRFTARRASFVDVAAVHDYLDTESTDRLDVLATQLGPVGKARRARSARPRPRSVATSSSLTWSSASCSRASAFAKRLVAHVAREGRVARGDVVMLVDLGYHGTVQRLITPALETALGVTVEGRYLLLRDSGASARHQARAVRSAPL